MPRSMCIIEAMPLGDKELRDHTIRQPQQDDASTGKIGAIIASVHPPPLRYIYEPTFPFILTSSSSQTLITFKTNSTHFNIIMSNEQFLRAIAGSIGAIDINDDVLNRRQWLVECGIQDLPAFDRMSQRAENRDTAAATIAGGLGYIPGFGVNNIAQPSIQALLASFNKAHGPDAAAVVVGALDRAVIPAGGTVFGGEALKAAGPSHNPQAPPKFKQIGPSAETAFNAVWNTPFGTFTRNYLLVDVIGRLVGIDEATLTVLRTTAGLEAAMERGYNAWKVLRERRSVAAFTATDGKVRYKLNFMRLPENEFKAHVRELNTVVAALYNYATAIAVSAVKNSAKSLGTVLPTPRFWSILLVLLPEGALAAGGALTDDPVKSIGLQALSDLVLIEGFKWRFEIEEGLKWMSVGNWDHDVGVQVGKFVHRKTVDGLVGTGNLMTALFVWLRELSQEATN